MSLYFLSFIIESAQSSTHYRYPVLHEVHWDADFQSTITRKLINETHGNKILFCLSYLQAEKNFDFKPFGKR